MKSIKIGYQDEITQEDLEIPVTVTKVTWMWNEEGYAKQFFGQKPKSLLSLTKSQTWQFSFYSKELAIELLGRFCGYNKYAYRTIIKYDNEVIFDGKLE